MTESYDHDDQSERLEREDDVHDPSDSPSSSSRQNHQTELSDNDEPKSVLLLSGANCSGKSVYLKQVAIIVYMAHIGRFAFRFKICTYVQQN